MQREAVRPRPRSMASTADSGEQHRDAARRLHGEFIDLELAAKVRLVLTFYSRLAVPDYFGDAEQRLVASRAAPAAAARRLRRRMQKHCHPGKLFFYYKKYSQGMFVASCFLYLFVDDMFEAFQRCSTC